MATDSEMRIPLSGSVHDAPLRVVVLNRVCVYSGARDQWDIYRRGECEDLYGGQRLAAVSSEWLR